MDEPSSPILDWREILGAVNMFEYYIIGCGRGQARRPPWVEKCFNFENCVILLILTFMESFNFRLLQKRKGMCIHRSVWYL